MSELRITISQLENLLDRQRLCVLDYIQNDMQPHKEDGPNDMYTELQIMEALRRADYPHDFNVLKKYIK